MAENIKPEVINVPSKKLQQCTDAIATAVPNFRKNIYVEGFTRNQLAFNEENIRIPDEQLPTYQQLEDVGVNHYLPPEVLDDSFHPDLTTNEGVTVALLRQAAQYATAIGDKQEIFTRFINAITGYIEKEDFKDAFNINLLLTHKNPTINILQMMHNVKVLIITDNLGRKSTDVKHTFTRIMEYVAKGKKK